jgi:tetratricopeptide (TPR) repeat protein
MNEQTLFNIYWTVIVGIIAQSTIAWEWGYKGMEYFRKHGPGPKIWGAFTLFAIGGIWWRISHLAFTYTSWKDCWPTLIALACFIVARLVRPKRLNSFLKAMRLYENYMARYVRVEPNDSDRKKARNDASLKKAESLYKYAIETSDKTGEIYDVAVGSFQLGMLLDLQGRDNEAIEAFTKALDLLPELRRDNNMIGTISGCYFRLGIIYKRKGDLIKAKSHITESLHLDEEINDIHGQQLCKETLDTMN